jgi:hypothetical protein
MRIVNGYIISELISWNDEHVHFFLGSWFRASYFKCINTSNEMQLCYLGFYFKNSICFGPSPCPSSGVRYCIGSRWYNICVWDREVKCSVRTLHLVYQGSLNFIIYFYFPILKKLIVYVNYCFIIIINNRILVVECYSSLVISCFSRNEFNLCSLFNLYCYFTCFYLVLKLMEISTTPHFTVPHSYVILTAAYAVMYSWWWVWWRTETCRVLEIKAKIILLHLVGCIYTHPLLSLSLCLSLSLSLMVLLQERNSPKNYSR